VASIGAGAPVLMLGASGPIGQFLIRRLAGQGVMMMAVSRNQPARTADQVIWIEHDLDLGPIEAEANVLVGLGPLRHVLAQVRASRRLGRVIAMSSASTLFKTESVDPAERALMRALIELEAELQAECARREIDLTLLKPTLIYAPGQDANVNRIAGLIGRLDVVPYCGQGLRQPVHADDLARLVLDCLIRGHSAAGTWLLGGGETLSYPAMLRRIASAHGRTPRLVPVPAVLMKSLLLLAHAVGRMRDIRAVMLDRQKLDLVVDDSPARENLGWNPRPFRPG
jgi:nucleoside-diphosphate-sugar epimerase